LDQEVKAVRAVPVVKEVLVQNTRQALVRKVNLAAGLVDKAGKVVLAVREVPAAGAVVLRPNP
jgi:hypothetical protein